MTPGFATSPHRWALLRIALTLLALVVPLAAATPDLVAADLAAADLAAAELVMFDDEACPWCQAWEREVGGVYDKTPEGRRAPLRRVALHGPRPADLSAIGGLVYTPTFVLLEQGREVGRIVGYPGPDHFWVLLGEALDKLETLPVSQ